jgi:hypothetical protein
MRVDRRYVLVLLAGGFATPAFAQAAKSEGHTSRVTAYAAGWGRCAPSLRWFAVQL